MTVRELINELAKWPQDAEVRVDDLGVDRPITELDYYAAYNVGYVVID
jgi:hypothetical protein